MMKLAKLGKFAFPPLDRVGGFRRLATNSLLRAATIGIRSGLVVGLAVWFEPSELGAYGLVVATIALATFLYGLDFYVFTLREISAREPARIRRHVRDQFLLFGAVYCVGSPLLVVVLQAYGLDAKIAILTALVAILQHAGLELYRILLRLERTLAGSVCLFLRDAAWVPLCLFAWGAWGSLELLHVLSFWLAGTVAGVLFSTLFLLRDLPASAAASIDPVWIRCGLKTGLRMLPGTLSLRGLFTADRMILALLVPPSALGAYVFFASLCAAFSALFETGALSFYWPRLLEAAKSCDRRRRRAAERALARACLIGTPGLVICCLLLGGMLAAVLPNPVYWQHLDLLLWIAAAYMFVTLSNIPHYRLYADNRDGAIVLCNVAAFAAFLSIAGALGLAGLAWAVPAAVLAGSALLLLLKWVAARHYYGI